ncbi:MAG TPA: membrane dipeptidase [Polyangiaceae bacterium]|nr:membrane dipeptidase [Polyangiaceae bacterium]
MSNATRRWQRQSVDECVQTAGVSRAAAELFLASDVVDLHVDSYIWVRVFGYRLDREHGPGLFAGRYYSQVDLPRLCRTGITGATWVITTNPLRGSRARSRALARNLAALGGLLGSAASDVALAASASDYRRIVDSGKHAAFIGLQGGNAFGSEMQLLDAPPKELIRVTLLHLNSSPLGRTSAPLANLQRDPLTPFGCSVVERLNQARIFVDLAHIDRRAFQRALDVHDPKLPPIVTHTGVDGCYPHWRNLNDAQIRAIAQRGGVVGIMYHTPFLGPGFERGSLRLVIDHLEHVIRVGGEHCAALGSDWDGAIVTPSDMPTCRELPRLVDEMLRRGWAHERIQNVLGSNFLRSLRDLRG